MADRTLTDAQLSAALTALGRDVEFPQVHGQLAAVMVPVIEHHRSQKRDAWNVDQLAFA